MAAGSYSNQNMRDIKPGWGFFIYIILLKLSSIHLAIHFVVEPAQNPSVPVLRVLSNCRLIYVSLWHSHVFIVEIYYARQNHITRKVPLDLGVEDQPSRSRRGGDLYSGDAALQEQSQ
jgi:hypothetical protein